MKVFLDNAGAMLAFGAFAFGAVLFVGFALLNLMNLFWDWWEWWRWHKRSRR